MKLLKLMIEDITEAGWVGHEAYHVYNMEDFNEVLEMYSRRDVVSMLEDDFDINDSWFINDGRIQSLNAESFLLFLEENNATIKELYSEIENENYDLYNIGEIKLEILKSAVEDIDTLEDEDYEVIYQDVDLESIAENLSEVSVDNLIQCVGYYGHWRVIYHDGTHLLIQE